MGDQLDRKLDVRVHPQAMRYLKRVVADLSTADALRFRGRAVSQEAVVNACWLMLGSWTLVKIEAELGPFVAELDELVGHRQATTATTAGWGEGVGGVVEDVTGPQATVGRRRGSG